MPSSIASRPRSFGPGCESDVDGEPVYGWAGWDHAERAKALVALYQDRKTREGWDKDRLTPMLAGGSSSSRG